MLVITGIIIINLLTPNVNYSGRTAPLTSEVAFYIFIQQIQVLNILNTVYTLRFFSSKCSLFHNSNVFGSCIIHILYTGCAKFKKNNSGAKRLMRYVTIVGTRHEQASNVCSVIDSKKQESLKLFYSNCLWCSKITTKIEFKPSSPLVFRIAFIFLVITFVSSLTIQP